MNLRASIKKYSWWIVQGLFITSASIALSSFAFHQKTTPLTIYRWNAHDALWHIALMEQIKKGLPPNNPLLAGEQLVGYHYATDVFFVVIHTITQIPLTTLYLTITPYLLAGLFGATTLWLFSKVFGRTLLALCGASLAVFGSGLAFFAPLLFPQARIEQSVFWLDQSVHYGINQQLLLSLSLVNILLVLFRFHLMKKWWLAGIILGLLGGIKVYGWMVIVMSVGIIGLIELIKTKNWRWLGACFIGTFIAATYFVFVGNKNGFPFLWSPGWFWQKMFESGEHLNWPTWELRRQVFALNHNYLRLFILWFEAGILFFVGNVSIKLLGLLAIPLLIKKTVKHKPWFWLLVLIALVSLSIPTFFIQKGVVWNTIQFMHYAAIPLCLLVTWLAHHTIHQRTLLYGVMISTIIVSLPTTVQALLINANTNNYIYYDQHFTESISQLRTQHTDKELLLSSSLTNDALIPALSGRVVYWADQPILAILNQESQNRKELLLSIEEGRGNCREDQLWITKENDQLQVVQCPLLIAPTTNGAL